MVEFAVLVPDAGVVITTVRAIPVTVMVLVSEPNGLVQTTVMVLLPELTGTVAGDVAAEPLTVQVIVPEPVALKLTEIGVDALLLPVAGELIVVTVGLPRVTTAVEVVAEPNALVHVALMLFAPRTSETVLVDALDEAAPFTVQVVPAGIDATPLTV